MIDDEPRVKAKNPLFYIGVAMLSVGSAALLYLAVEVVRIVKHPGESHTVQWAEEITKDGKITVKSAGTEIWSIHASEAFLSLLLLLLGVIFLHLVTSILLAFVTHGVKLLMEAKDKRPY